MSSRIRITWLPSEDRCVIDCLFPLRGRRDRSVQCSSRHYLDQVESLELGELEVWLVGKLKEVFDFNVEGASMVVVELKVGG